jgi:DNA (cytosine-5)-methyltransferase 1
MAGFNIVGIDVADKKDYPGMFIQKDFRSISAEYINSTYDAVHFSPPCQAFSCATPKEHHHKHVNFIPEVLDLVSEITIPVIIENVPQAPIRPDIILTGANFGLKLIRKRIFQLDNWFCLSPQEVHYRKRSVKNGDLITVAGTESHHRNKGCLPYREIGTRTIFQLRKDLMEVGWMNDSHSVREAIPPKYTEFIGQLLIEYLDNHK